MSQTFERMLYDSVNRVVLTQVPLDATRVLDLGCGTGAFGKAVKERQRCSVVGVTYNEDEASLARMTLDRVEVADLNGLQPAALGRFDCVVCSHVLEHLYHPECLLAKLLLCLDARGSLVVALPNVLHWRQRFKFLRGEFRYTAFGLLDRTHYRFYDWQCAQELLGSSGYEVLSAQADGNFPYSRFVPGMRRRIDRLALRTFPGFFGWQFVFRCRPVQSG